MQARYALGAGVLGLLIMGSTGAMAQQNQQWQQQQRQMQQRTSGQGIEQQARQFLQQVEQNVSQAVQQGNAEAIRRWTENYVADTATFSAMVQVGGGRTPKGFRVAQFDKQELLQRQAAVMSMMPNMLSRVENYDLQIRVMDIESVGDNAAIVKTRISESATLTGAQSGDASAQQSSQSGYRFGSAGQGSGSGLSRQMGQSAATGAGGGTQQGSSGSQSQMQISFNSISECTHLIRREQSSDQMQIGMSNCSAEVTF